MNSALCKIHRRKGKPVSPIEENVAQYIFDIQSTSQQDWRSELANVKIFSVRQFDLPTKTALVVYVPSNMLKAFHRIQSRLIIELEKKLSGKQVHIIGQRRIIAAPSHKNFFLNNEPRRYSNTMAYVHDAILSDLLYPVEITGRRIQVKTNGRKIYKIFLSAKDKESLEGRLDTYIAVYKQLTGKNITFIFPNES